MLRKNKLRSYGLVIILLLSLILISNRYLGKKEVCNNCILTVKPIRYSDSDKWILTPDISKSIGFESQSYWNILQIHSHERCGQLSTREAMLQTINSGAKYIYITDLLDENTFSILSRFKYNIRMSALKYNGTVVNPIELHFYNTKNTRQLNRPTSFQYQLGIWNTSLVQKLVQPRGKDSRFQDRAPALLLAPKDMSPFTFNNILFHHDSFWAIVPITKTVVWSLWVQRLLRELNSSVRFSTHHDVTSDDCVIKQKINISEIKNHLNNWKCEARTSFFTCMLNLSEYLVKLGYFSNNDYRDIENWAWELLQHGYQQPELPSNTAFTSRTASERNHRLLYHPNYRQTGPLNFKQYCKNVLPQCEMKSNSQSKPLNILLVLVFNKPGFYQNLRYLEAVYRPYFKYILYCGQNLTSTFTHYNSLNRPVTFVEVKRDFAGGAKGYHCIQLAIQMDYDVEGYFHVGDDVLLNVWNLHKIPTDKAWFQHSMRTAHISQPTVPGVWKSKSWWVWTAGGMGHKHLEQALAYTRFNQQNDNVVKTFLEQLARSAGGQFRAVYEASDIFYIPQIVSQQYLNIVQIFGYYNVHLEIAVPTIINGLVDRKDIQVLQGNYLWYNTRKLYRETFDVNKVFIHAIKTSACLKDETCTDFLCNKYLPCIKDLMFET